MKKIIDNIFGEMEYVHSWTKKDSFTFFGKKYNVNITAQAYQNDEILESQKENYQKYQNFITQHESTIKKKLLEYCHTICNNNNIVLEQCLQPKTIIFERDGSWGILFESNCDIEHGVALFMIDDDIKTGPQDIFL